MKMNRRSFIVSTAAATMPRQINLRMGASKAESFSLREYPLRALRKPSS